MKGTQEVFMANIQSLANGADKANERSRNLFYLITLVSFLIILASFNAYFSWDRKLNAQDRLIFSEEIKAVPKQAIKPYIKILTSNISKDCSTACEDEILDNLPKYLSQLQGASKINVAAKNALDAFVDSLYKNNLLIDKDTYYNSFMARQVFTIPIIGLTCSVDDIYLIGGFIIIVLLTYYFFNLRRENRTVFKLYKKFMFISKSQSDSFINSYLTDIAKNKDDTAKSEKEKKEDNEKFEEAKYHLKINYLEYIYNSSTLHFIFGTVINDDYYFSNNSIISVKEQDLEKIDWNEGGMQYKSNSSARRLLELLDFLPFYALIIVLGLDAYSAVVRGDYLLTNDFLELGIKYAVTLVMLVFTFVQCKLINIVASNTHGLNRQMYYSLNKFKGENRKQKKPKQTKTNESN